METKNDIIQNETFDFYERIRKEAMEIADNAINYINNPIPVNNEQQYSAAINVNMFDYTPDWLLKK